MLSPYRLNRSRSGKHALYLSSWSSYPSSNGNLFPFVSSSLLKYPVGTSKPHCNTIPNSSTSDEGSLSHNFRVNERLQLFLGQIILILIEIEELLWDRFSGRFILWIMVWREVWVLERLLDRDSLDWVESQQLLEEIDGVWFFAWHEDLFWEEGLEIDLLLEG